MSLIAPLRLIDHARRHTAADIAALAYGPIFACDFYVDGIEWCESIAGGYRDGRLINIDHHAPVPRMRHAVSSANLALDYVHWHGSAPSDSTVVISHTDCDSILSSGIVSGRLPPDPRFGTAAIAADHTGEANDIADLLQGLEPLRSIDTSMEALGRMLRGERLGAIARDALDERRARRRTAADAVRAGLFRMRDGIAYAETSDRVEGEFFPALLPDAQLIVVATPRRDAPGRYDVKVRLGRAAPPGITLDELRIEEIDPSFGGRWNAGSNRRSGGTTLPLAAYVDALAARLDRAGPASAQRGDDRETR